VNYERDLKKGNEMLRVLGCFAVVLFITTTGKMLVFFKLIFIYYISHLLII
jgi:hypothetical protein